MQKQDCTFEIHVHGQVPLAQGTTKIQIEEALKPIWSYAGAKSFVDGAESHYPEEPGIKIVAEENLLQICWTVRGEDDFRGAVEEASNNLNEISSAGASLEVTLYDLSFDFDGEDDDESPFGNDDSSDHMESCDGDLIESRDDTLTMYIGPNAEAIMKVQRDHLVGEVVMVMQEHFEAEDLGGVIGEIDKLYAKRNESAAAALMGSWMSRIPGLRPVPATGHGIETTRGSGPHGPAGSEPGKDRGARNAH